ncbi:MAG TPA: hypothetical protein VGB73_02210 [Pyrinomonadaceae bacterium]|jgi:hypothetical protein
MAVKSKRLHLLWLAAAFAITLTGSWTTVSAQDDTDEAGSRQIKLTDFVKERPAIKAKAGATGDTPSWNGTPKPASKPTASAPARRVYRRVAAVRRTQPVRATRGNVVAHKPAAPEKKEYAEVGVTIWRLRRAKSSDDGPKIKDLKSYEWWTPERIEGTTPLSLGDRLRLSIESPRAGYLYVINSTQYADGTTGQPRLIFPTTRTRGGDNKVVPGRLVDIPDQDDATNYFTLTSDPKRTGKSREVGEILTVLVSKDPIAELAHGGRDALPLSAEQVTAWEKKWGGEVDLFELKDGAGLAWTKEEQEASSASGRSLTQEEPTPQTIYSVATRPGSPVLVKVQLLYGQSGTARK